jgi:PEP-CTERM motif
LNPIPSRQRFALAVPRQSERNLAFNPCNARVKDSDTTTVKLQSISQLFSFQLDYDQVLVAYWKTRNHAAILSTGISMRFSAIFATVFATLTWSAAQAASVTVNFPDVGDTWLDTTTMTSGTLTVADPFTGNLTGAHSYVNGTLSDPALSHFVTTHISGAISGFNSQPANPVIDILIGNAAAVQTTLPCCGLFTVNFSADIPSPLPPTQYPLSITYELTADTDAIAGDFISFSAGAPSSSIILSGYYAVPEPSAWAMMLLGFGGLAFVGYRKATGASADVSV